MTELKTFKHWVIFDAFGEGAPVAYKLHKENKDVLLATVDDITTAFSKETSEEHTRRMSNYDGVLPKMTAEKALAKLKSVKNKDDYFLFFSLNCLYKYSETLEKAGFKYGNFFVKEDYELEEDRNSAKDIVKKYYTEISVAPVHEFKKAQDGIKFLEDDTEGFFVLKGDQDQGAKTIVPTMEDQAIAKGKLIEALTTNGKAYEAGGFILEEKIKEPIEFTPAAFFWNGELVFLDIDIENKPIGSGNISYQVGAAQSFIAPLDKKSFLAKAAFPPFIHQMAKKRTGLFNIDCGILKDRKSGKLYFSEFCTRPGYDSLFTEIAMSRSASGFFEDIVNCISPLIRDYGAAVRIFNLPSKAPYYYENDDLKDMKVDWKTDEGLWPFDFKLVDGEKMTAGYMPDVCIATGYGKDIETAVSMAYDNVDQFGLINAYFRPEHDFMGEYKTSIPCRWKHVKWMADEQMTSPIPI